MKPKLWDGPNPVGEARARGNERIDTPYLTASGPGFSAHKKGPFREVYGENPSSEVVGDGWVSSSNNAKTDVVFSGSPTIYTPYTKRGTQHNEKAEAFAPGTNVRPDGKGGAYSAIFIGDEYNDFGQIYARKYALVSVKGTGRRVKQLSGPLWSYVFNAAVSANASNLIGSGITNGIGDGVEFGTEMTTTNHLDGDVYRAHPVLVVLAKVNDSWLNGYVELPYETSDDTDVPAYCHLGGNRIAAIWATNAASPPKLRYSDNFGATWSGGIDVSGICAGFNSDWNVYAGANVAPQTEAEIAEREPSLNPMQVRSRYLTQGQITRRFAAHLGGAGLDTYPASHNKIVVVASGPYWNDSTHVVAVALVDVNGGVVRRTEWDAGEQYSSCYLSFAMIGQGAWVCSLVKTDTNYVNWRTTLWSVVTFDFGASYQNVNLPADTFTHSIRPILPYRSDRDRFKLIILGTDGEGNRIMYRTDDLQTFKPGPVVGKREWFASGAPGANFNEAVFIGTRDNPGHFYPPAPWVLDDRVPTPDWWMTT